MSWGDLPGLASLGAMAVTMLLSFLHWRGRSEYASHKQVEGLGERLQHVEAEMMTVVKHRDLTEMYDRMRAVETATAVMGAEVKHMGQAMGRIDAGVSRLTHALLEREQAPPSQPRRRPGAEA